MFIESEDEDTLLMRLLLLLPFLSSCYSTLICRERVAKPLLCTLTYLTKHLHVLIV